MSDSVDRVFVHALNTVKRIPRTGTARPPTAERLKLYGLYKQSMEGDVEGVMDRPVGNTTDVYAECEKWDAWFAQRGLTRTDAKRRYISTLIDTMHQYASQTQEARELVDELEFVWDQIKANTSSGSESPMSSPVRTLGVPPLSPQHQQQQQQQQHPRSWQQQQRTYASIGGRLAQQPAYEDMVAIANANGNGSGNGNGNRGRAGESSSRLRVLSPVSQPDDMYQRRSRNYDDEDYKGSHNQDDDGEEEEEEEEYEEAQDNFDEEGEEEEEDDDDDQNENTTQHTTTNSNSHEDQTEASSLQQHHGKDTPLMTPPPSNRKSSFSKNHPQPNSRRWRSRVEQALTKMTAEIAAVREQMETRAIQQRRRSTAWAWIKWLTWITLRQVLWDLAVLAMLLIWMRIKGDRRIEDKLKAGWSELKGKLGRLRLGRQPRIGMLP